MVTILCPSAELVAALADGKLTDNEEAEIGRHVLGCGECGELFWVLRDGPSSPLPNHADLVDEPGFPPEWLGDIRLGGLIGTGAMGIVYRGHDHRLNRDVAVKFPAPELALAKTQKRFLNEGRALARCQHPNLLTVYHCAEYYNRPYIVTELVAGRNLRQLDRRLDFAEILRIMEGLASGLAEVHRRQVIHRDIKPENILLSENGEPKLVDFGLAAPADTGDTEPHRPQSGTPFYMAAELRRGQPATKQSDVFALGLTIYELGLTHLGTVPPPLLAELAALAQPPGAELPPLHELVKSVDRGFADLVMRCLRSNPAERYASGEALLEAVQRYKSLGPADASLPTPLYPGLRAFDRQHRSVFFGRAFAIEQALVRLDQLHLLVISGNSGVGKSSLARAGIIPALMSGALHRGDAPLPEYTPLPIFGGRKHFLNLVTSLFSLLRKWTSAATAAKLAVQLREQPALLSTLLQKYVHSGCGLILLIDQAEELFFDTTAAIECSDMLRLLHAIPPNLPGVYVLLTVRSDHLPRLLAALELTDEQSRVSYVLSQLSETGIRDSIVRPAAMAGLSFESPELVDSLVGSVAGSPDGLALLQFTLQKLVGAAPIARARQIRQEELVAIGRVDNALAHHIKAVMEHLKPEQRLLTEALLQVFANAECGGSSRTIPELIAGCRGFDKLDEASVGESLNALVSAQLLYVTETADPGAPDYRLASAVLLRSWDVLRQVTGLRQLAASWPAELLPAVYAWRKTDFSERNLWNKRKLAELAGFELTSLSEDSQSFLAASHRAVRWRRYRLLALAGISLALSLTILAAVRHTDAAKVRRAVMVRRAHAQQAFLRGAARVDRALSLRTQALRLFDEGLDSSAVRAAPAELQTPRPFARAEESWSSYLGEEKGADEEFQQATEQLENALFYGLDRTELRALFGEVLYHRILLAERLNDEPRRDELNRRVASYDNEEVKKKLAAPARLRILIHPEPEQVTLARYEKQAGRLSLLPGRKLAEKERAELVIPPGSYLLTVEHPARPTVRMPILAAREEKISIDFALPHALPRNFIYIPAGCFLFGSAEPESLRRAFLGAPPLHRVCTPAYLIQQTETTFADWIEFLQSLLPRERKGLLPYAASTPDHSSRYLELKETAPGVFGLAMQPISQMFVIDSATPVTYSERTRRKSQRWLRFPVSGISPQDAARYVAWLGTSGRVPSARLCSEVEWERAGRGADGRLFPHGDQLQPDDANFDETYGRLAGGFGPDEVGSHPVSKSPFGLFDMTGNVWEITRSIDRSSAIVFRGGEWYQGQVTNQLNNRTPGEPATRDIAVGLRVCADAEKK